MSKLICNVFAICLLFSVLFADSVVAQSNYTVIKVYGNISLQKSKKELSQGDQFSEKDVLVFRDEESKAVVINSAKGRFFITPPSSTNLASKSSFVPAMSNVSSRSGGLISIIDLKNYFDGNFLILNRIKININHELFPMNDTSFFFLRYVYKGEIINKKLDFMGDSLLIDKEALFTVDGKPIPNPDISDMKLYYYSSKQAALINEFEPVFPDMDALKIEIKLILSVLEGKSSEEKMDEIISYLNENYGKSNRENVVSWMKKNFDL